MALNQVKAIIADQLDLNSSSHLSKNTSLEELSLGSMGTNDIYIALEDLFEIEFPSESIEYFDTIGDISDFIENYE